MKYFVPTWNQFVPTVVGTKWYIIFLILIRNKFILSVWSNNTLSLYGKKINYLCMQMKYCATWTHLLQGFYRLNWWQNWNLNFCELNIYIHEEWQSDFSMCTDFEYPYRKACSLSRMFCYISPFPTWDIDHSTGELMSTYDWCFILIIDWSCEVQFLYLCLLLLCRNV